MPRLLSRLAVFAASSLLATSVSAGTNDVLLRSGVVAPDGRGLSFFATPRASRATRVVFGGTSSAVLTKSGSTFAVVAKTGDALPAPLAGTFNSFNDPTINDSGAVVFRTTLNSTSAESGLFFYDGATITPISLFGGTAGGLESVSGSPDVNNSNEVVYTTGGDTTLLLWSGGVSTPILHAGDPAPGGGTFTDFGDRPVLNDAGVVAFEAEVAGGPEGVFTWDATNGARAVALEGTHAPGFPSGVTFRAFARNTPVSINAAGAVAFVTDTTPGIVTAVFRYDPSGPTLTMIAREGGAVGSESISLLQKRYAGINVFGTVAFYALLSSSGYSVVQSVGGVLSSLTGPIGNVNEFSPRLTSASHLIWRGSGLSIQRFDGAVTDVLTRTDATPLGTGLLGHQPSINDNDVAAFRVTQSVLYGYDAGALTVLLTPGDPMPGGSGTVMIFGPHVLRRTSVALNVTDTGYGTLLALKRGDDPFAAVVRWTDVTPAGGTFDLYDDILDVNGQTMVFESTITDGAADSGLFRVKASTGIVTTLALAGDTAPNGALFTEFTAVAMAGKEAAFLASLDDGNDGLFITDHGAITTIALTGDPAPGTAGTFSSFSAIATRGRRVAFNAGTSAGNGIFAFNRGIITKVALEGDPEPGGGTFTTIDGFSPPALGPRGPSFVADTSGTPFEGLYAANGSVLTARALLGDPVTGGGIITSMSTGEPLSFVGRTIVYEAGLDAASGASSALLSNTP